MFYRFSQLVLSVVVGTLVIGCGAGGDSGTTNAAPVANAGTAQSVVAGATVTLDGSASSDANGDPLTYLWTLTSKPAGSTAALSSSTAALPTFTDDLAGTYVATLTVNDGQVSSPSATVTVTAAVADAAPVVISSTTQVAINGVITVTFSEAMDASTLNTRTFTMSGPDGAVPGTVEAVEKPVLGNMVC